MRQLSRTALPALAWIAAAGCATPMNYTDLSGPRYAGGPVVRPAAWSTHDTIRVVTFNIQFARHVDRAIALFEAADPLRGADVVALQEMDEPGTAAVAAALGMHYVYYPATVHPQSGRDFGNAILSPWPISDDRKVILPHLGRFGKTQRIAVAATVRVAGTAVRVYSVHMGTGIETGGGRKQDQARAVIADAKEYARVIIAGDMNSHGVGGVFSAAGYSWPTRDQPPTDKFFSFDHLFLAGLHLPGPGYTGVIHDNLGASDHRPVWARVVIDHPEDTHPRPATVAAP